MVSLANLSLKQKVTIVILAGALIGLGTFSWLAIRAVNESVDRTLDERLMVARIIASYIDENISHVILHMQSAAHFSSFPTQGEFDMTAMTLRGRLAESGTLTQSVILLDTTGTILQVQPYSSSSIDTDLSLQPSVNETLRTGKTTVSGLLYSPITTAPVVLVTAPLLDTNNAIFGALAITLDIEPSAIDTISQAISIGQTGYAEIVDGNGIVLARTKPANPPAEFEQSDHPGKFAQLIDQNQPIVGVCHRCHETPQSTIQRRRDIIAFAPLTNASWGVAIRQSEEEALAPAMQLRQQMLSLGAVILAVTFLTAWVMVMRLVKPINVLTAEMKKVAGGDFSNVKQLKRRDEIGQLNSAFYSMTQDLAKSRNELSKSRDQLMQRNRELSSLNSVASAVNQSLDLEKVLDAAMRRIHELAGTTTGCVFLCNSKPNTLQIVNGVGRPSAFQCKESGQSETNCACHQVIKQGQTLMVNSPSQCPLLNKNSENNEKLGYFVSVPLKARDKTLGIMNIGGYERQPFTENDFSILDSIAYHIGLAIENSSLYEDAKEKEQVRGQLLSSVINAQEEERKRIARELHDEYGQSLTALKVGIESMDQLLLPEQQELRKKMKGAADLVVNSLEDLRRLTVALRPYALDELGLISAIRAHAQRNLETLGINAKIETKGLNRRLTPQVETSVFRIVQEAIHNIIKHAGAHNVNIQLIAQDGKIDITVQDDGTGFDVESTLKSRVGKQSLGLLGIQERANLLGGIFNIESQIGRGTRLFVEIPINR